MLYFKYNNMIMVDKRLKTESLGAAHGPVVSEYSGCTNLVFVLVTLS